MKRLLYIFLLLNCLRISAADDIKVVKSYYELPEGKTLVKAYRSTFKEIIEQFSISDIKIEAINKEEPEEYIGPAPVTSLKMHGGVDAPFSRTKMSINSREGIKITFKKLQSQVGMTIHAVDKNDVGFELNFFDAEGKLLKSVKDSTSHIEGLKYDSKGAVFRGIISSKACIKSVQLIPKKIPKTYKNSYLIIDYFCFSSEEGKHMKNEDILKIVNELGHDKYKIRKAASKELEKLGPGIIRLLKEYKLKNDPEITMRIREINKKLEALKVNPTPNGYLE